MDKKGQINQMLPAVMAVILLGALITVGMLTLYSFQETTYATASGRLTNETVASVTETPVSLAAHSLRSGRSCGLYGNANVTLASNGAKIMPGNFTVSSDGCSIKFSGSNDDAATYNATNWKVTYSYAFDNATVATNAVGDVNTSISNLASTWMPIIIVVLAAGIVLAVLLGAFSGKQK